MGNVDAAVYSVLTLYKFAYGRYRFIEIDIPCDTFAGVSDPMPFFWVTLSLAFLIQCHFFGLEGDGDESVH